MLSLWFIVAFTLILVYPARQVFDLVWVLTPLWALAAIELAHDIRVDSSSRLVAAGEAAAVFLLLAIVWMNLLGAKIAIVSTESSLLRAGLLVGLLALGR